MEKIERAQVFAIKELGYGEGTYAIESMHKREMAIRTKELRLVDKPWLDSYPRQWVESLWIFKSTLQLNGQYDRVNAKPQNLLSASEV